jgi:hypothetical protein
MVCQLSFPSLNCHAGGVTPRGALLLQSIVIVWLFYSLFFRYYWCHVWWWLLENLLQPPPSLLLLLLLLPTVAKMRFCCEVTCAKCLFTNCWIRLDCKVELDTSWSAVFVPPSTTEPRTHGSIFKFSYILCLVVDHFLPQMTVHRTVKMEERLGPHKPGPRVLRRPHGAIWQYLCGGLTSSSDRLQLYCRTTDKVSVLYLQNIFALAETRPMNPQVQCYTVPKRTHGHLKF